MDKDDFLVIVEMLWRQYSKDMESLAAGNSDLWAAALRMLSVIFGREGGLMVERWIFESECGKYQVPDFPYSSASELWDALSAMR